MLVTGFQGKRLKCCSVNFSDFHPECFPIRLPDDDPVHGKSGERCQEYARSGTAPRIGCTLGESELQAVLQYKSGRRTDTLQMFQYVAVWGCPSYRLHTR
jgi:hypothetical protein